jgi:hypothetical protein
MGSLILPDDALRIPAAAAALGMSVTGVHAAIKQGRLGSVTVGGVVFIGPSDIEAYRANWPNGQKPRGRPKKNASLAADTHRLFAEGMRHVWDIPEEDAAWAHLQEGM